MSVTAQQLHKGGNVFYRVQIPRPGAPAEVRLKAARVIDVERGAARIRLLEGDQTLKVRFADLAPDVDYLVSRARERERPARRENARPADEPAPAPATPPTALETPARPLTHTLAEQLKHVELATVHALPGPVVANEQASPPPTTEAAPATPPPAHEDVQAWLEIGKDLRAKIDREILTAPREKVAGLMAQRKQLETELQAKERARTMPKGIKHTPAKRDEILKDAAAGMKSAAIARKHGLPITTVAGWIRKASSAVKKSPRPAAPVAARVSARVSARKAPPVRPSAPGVALARIGSVDGSLRENRRLRAMLGTLLTRVDSVSPDEVAAQNRQLQSVVDLLLGVE